MHSEVPRTWFTHLYLSGNTHEIQIGFPEAGQIRITGLQMNVPQPFICSGLRICMVAFCIFLIQLFANSSNIWTIKLLDGGFEVIVCVLSAILLSILIYLIFSLSNPLLKTEYNAANRQYQELAISLSEGKRYLRERPSEILVQMDNPYDPGARYLQNVPYLWDVAYYQGRYYVYFGVVPCLLFYLPFYLITGNNLPNYPVVIISEIGLLLGFAYLITAFIRKYFRDTSLGVFLILYAVTAFGSGSLRNASSTTIYTVPIMLGNCFAVWGLSLWIEAAGEKICTWKLLLGSLLIAMTAGCRPQMLVTIAFAFPLYLPYIVDRKEKTVKIRIGGCAKDIVAILLPFLVIGAGIMYYNYARFGLFTDFGANYNLTTNDMTRRGFQLARLPVGFLNYLFRMPDISLFSPFIRPLSVITAYQGKTIWEEMYGGILFLSPFLLSIGAAGVRKKNLIEKKLWVIFILSIVLSTIVIIADTEMAGILARYMQDFAWLLFIAANLVVLSFFEMTLEKVYSDFLKNTLKVLAGITVVVNLLLFLEPGETNSLLEAAPEIYLKIAHIIMFWR